MTNRRTNVDYDNLENIKFAPAHLSSFGWLRTANPTTIFDYSSHYGDSSLYWINSATGVGNSVTAVPADSFVVLAAGLNPGTVIRQTKTYHHYQPGKGQLILNSFKFTEKIGGVIQRIGYFDDNNGCYLEQTSDGLYFCIKNKGVVVTRVHQNDWNIDRMDGSGDSRTNDSKILIDVRKPNIFTISLEWLGVGTVNFGFFVDGEFILCHKQHHANEGDGNIATTYMSTASLPVRAEITSTIENFGGGVYMFCTTVISEGGYEDDSGPQFTCNNGITPISVTTRRPVLTLRSKLLGPGAIVNRSQIIPKLLDIYNAGTQSCFYEVVLNGTLNPTTWNSVNADLSVAEYNTDSTTITGGTVIASGYIPSSVTVKSKDDVMLLRNFSIDNVANGGIQETLSIVITSIGGANSSDVCAAMTWQELH